MGRTTTIGADPGLTWQGAYDSEANYFAGDGVYISGKSYICIKSHTGKSPPNSAYWSIMLSANVSRVKRQFFVAQ